MDDLPIMQFADGPTLRQWMEQHHTTSPGVWLRIFKKSTDIATVSFKEVLETGLCFGWSESQRKALDEVSYLQRFTPRRTRGTASERNRRLAQRLISEGRMTPAGLTALGLDTEC
jgi:uncharacterized protein YdeI (YjbR/CyaY-like superfamily)